MANQTKRAVTNIVADMAVKDSKGATIDVNNPKVEGSAEFGGDVEIDGKLKINSVDDIEVKTGGKINQIPIKCSKNYTVVGSYSGIPATDEDYSKDLNYYGLYSALKKGRRIICEDVSQQILIGDHSYTGRIIIEGHNSPNGMSLSFYRTYRSDTLNTTLYIPKKSGTIALTSDITDTAYYRHTITMYDADNEVTTNSDDSSKAYGRCICFTCYTKSNEAIDSLTDLFTQLGNTDISVSGRYTTDEIIYSIHIGTASDSTYIVTSKYAKRTLTTANLVNITDSVTTL